MARMRRRRETADEDRGRETIAADAREQRPRDAIETEDRSVRAREHERQPPPRYRRPDDDRTEGGQGARHEPFHDPVVEARVRDLPRYRNQCADELAHELREAATRSFVPLTARSPELRRLVQEDEVKFVVTVDGQLRFGPTDLKHPVLSRGEDVIAAGQAMLFLERGMPPTVLFFDNSSGHYRPLPASLDVAEEAFKREGFLVAPTARKVYEP